MAKTDYSGRTVDLLIFQGTSPEGEKLVTLGFQDAGGEVTTGIQKICQTFTILFLTEVGSVPMMPLRGTGFVTAVRQGRLKDESDVQSEFALAAESVKTFLNLEADLLNLPEDETLESALLDRFDRNESTGTLTLYIRITSVAGEAREVFLPISVPIR